MVDYTTKAEITRLTNYRNAQSLVLVGIVFWEILITLPFDWTVVSGKRRARWPMIAYFIARASMVLHVLALTIDSHGREIISCDAQVWILKITDATGIWASSLLLALRTIAVWSSDRKIIIPIGVLYAGLIVVYCMTWQPSTNLYNGLGCVVVKSVPYHILLTEFTYTMIFDLVITVLAVVKLWAWRKEGGISQMLLENGIGYFVFATCGNLVQAVLAALNLSGLLNILFLPVAMCISVIASTRVFIRLLTHIDPHHTYTSHTGNSHSGGTGLTPNHYQPSRLGQQSHLTSIGATQSVNAFPVAPGFDQPYGLNTVKNPRHRITIQTHTAIVDDKNAELDLEYGRKREMEDDDSFNQHMGQAH